MNKETQATGNDMGTVAEEARALMAATAEVVEEARAANAAVHQHPYQAIGIAFGVGALIGYLAMRRCSRDGD